MPVAVVDDCELFYEVTGQGPPCLVMHGGLGFDHTLYRTAFDRLADRLTVIYYDHRGNGRSGRPPLESITMERLADDAAGLLDALGVDRSIVMGHSYGGFVAQEMALRHPGRIRGLVLLNTTPGQLGESESPDDEQGEPPPPELAEALQAEPATDAEFADVARVMLRYFLYRTPAEALEPLLRTTIFSASAMRRSMEVLAGWSSVDRLAQIAAPTLVVAGRHDVACSPPQSTRIASRIPEAEVVVFEESGHLPFVDEPEALLATTQGWLARRLGVDIG